jgi:hypothetical protein
MDTAGLEMSDNFISIAEGQKDDVMSMLSNAFQDKIARNRSILSIGSFCMVGDRYLVFGGLFCK